MQVQYNRSTAHVLRENTKCPSKEYHTDGTMLSETNIYLSGDHVIVDSMTHIPLAKFTS